MQNDFRLIRKGRGFNVQINNRREPVAFKGSFWFDGATFELPVDLNVEQAFIRTAYARTPIARSDALLPKRSELTVTHLSGATERDGDRVFRLA